MINKKIEILAPAGSMPILKAAVTAGADAVYVGGARFGARAYADNFDNQTLVDAVHYVHLHGRKLYLTVNTLFRQDELDSLYTFLKDPYEAGLDAVIVQDLGVVSYIRRQFPKLAVHISTQMTITQPYGAQYMKRLGAVRIVPARELSLCELRQLKEQTGLEVEVFVHGALCYCYSGQCLLSSMIGGRSGNRGRCAQPCRLSYQTEKDTSDQPYILSPKDLCGLDILPELMDCGIDSLKIEGRMKNGYYVAATVAAYRKAVDAVYAGSYSKQMADELKEVLAEVYNRGGFTEGYFRQHNGVQMMSMGRPNHQGVKIGEVETVKAGTIGFRAMRSLTKGDVINILPSQGDELTLTVPQDYKIHAFVVLNAPKTKYLHAGMSLYRTRNAGLISALSEEYIEHDRKEKVKIEVRIVKGECAKMDLKAAGVHVCVQGEQVQQAQKQPLNQETVIDKIGRLGNTPFEAEQISVTMDKDAFMTVKGLNELRRLAVETLQGKLETRYQRETVRQLLDIQGNKHLENAAMPAQLQKIGEASEKKFRISAVVSDARILKCVLEHKEVSRIYLDFIDGSDDEMIECAARILDAGCELILCMPQIGREKCIDTFMHLAGQIDRYDGVLIRNMDSFGYVMKQAEFADTSIIGDWSLYAYNQEAIRTYLREKPDMQFVMPRELSYEQLKALWKDPYAANTHLICDIYGNVPVMVSAQCTRRNLSDCDHRSQKTSFTDRKHIKYTAQCVCRYCYNLIYNEVTYDLSDVLSDVGRLAPGELRMIFRQEEPAQIHDVITHIMAFDHGDIRRLSDMQTTRGHFRRGIE